MNDPQSDASQNEIYNAQSLGDAAAVPQVPVEEPAKLGPLQRLTGVIFSPGETFADMKRKPSWVVPLIITAVLACGGSLIFSWRVKPDWDALIRNQIRQGVERRGGTMPSEDVIAQQVKIGKLFAQFAPILALVIAPLITVVFAGIYALGLLVMQGQTPFSKVLSVVAWGSCGTDLIKTIVVSASLLIRDPSSIDPTEPGSVSATNLALLLPSGISPVLKALASQVDVFTIWFLILMTIGFAAVSNRRSFKTGNSGTLVFGLFALWVIVRVGWAAISGR